jgi:hypothetical protein
VLILAPELYAPLRELGSQFHAGADGLAAAERIIEALDVRRTRCVGQAAEHRKGPLPDQSQWKLVGQPHLAGGSRRRSIEFELGAVLQLRRRSGQHPA